MRRWTSFEGHPQPTRGSGISLQAFHSPLLKAAHLSWATSLWAGQPSRRSVTSRVWLCPRGPSEFVPELEQQERKPQALHTDRGSPHKATPALVGISRAHPWPPGLWVPPSHLWTKDVLVSQGTRGVWGASSPPLLWPKALCHFWSLQATGRSATPGRERNNTSCPGLWVVRPLATEADRFRGGRGSRMPRPLLCPPSQDHPPCPPDSCVSDWGPESTSTPHTRGEGSSSPLSPTSPMLWFCPIPLPPIPGLVSASPLLHLVDMSLVLTWVAPPGLHYQPPCILVPWREALHADQTCK